MREEPFGSNIFQRLFQRLASFKQFKRSILLKMRNELRNGMTGHLLTVASEFLDEPTLDNIDRLSNIFGYSVVRNTIVLLDNVILEQFFYGKLPLYPIWIEQFIDLLDAARPQAEVLALITNWRN